MAARRALFGVSAAAATAVGFGSAYVALGAPDPPLADAPWSDVSSKPIPRREQIEALRASGRSARNRSGSKANEPFDVLIIGGGATGAGAALDAATRGLRVALVEGEDFASGTSSRSTKLVHGGVRYLEKAVFQFDPGQLKLVFEALRERRRLLKNAPHLSWPLPIATPCYEPWEAPYYWAGMKAYDLVAFLGGGGLEMSTFETANETLSRFPNIARVRSDTGQTLKGAVVYQDGQFDDARMCVALAATAARAGAVVANHVRVERFVFEDHEGKMEGTNTSERGRRVVGAMVRDARSSGGDVFFVRARVVVNATGPFTDSVRRMADPARASIMTPAGGTHLVLPAHFAPKTCGLIVPKTEDGRVVFLLPWLGGALAGTTDAPSPVTMTPRPTSEEVAYILEQIAPYVSIPATIEDVSSAWSGIRPLARPPSEDAGFTSNVSRDHVVADERDGVVTVTGGKWTTYRLMAEHAVDAAIRAAAVVDPDVRKRAGPCRTANLAVIGAHGYGKDLAQKISVENARSAREDASRTAGRRRRRRIGRKESDFDGDDDGDGTLVDPAVVDHLVQAYGDRAVSVLRLARERPELSARVSPRHPVLVAEIVHAAREEFCATARDFLARRSRLAFLDVAAAEKAAPLVNSVLARELGWSWWRAARELRETKSFLRTFRWETRSKPASANA
jgi:glycerol-3-phosphate dehydrogenase